MKDLDDVCLDIKVILDDVQMKSEQKKQFELNAERLGHEIANLKGKAVSIIQKELVIKQTN